MWVFLVVSILNKASDAGRVHTLQRRIRELPSDLHRLFRDIITRDSNCKDELLYVYNGCSWHDTRWAWNSSMLQYYRRLNQAQYLIGTLNRLLDRPLSGIFSNAPKDWLQSPPHPTGGFTSYTNQSATSYWRRISWVIFGQNLKVTSPATVMSDWSTVISCTS